MSIDERLSTEKITPELIDYVVKKIAREIQPEKIILFGSYARGDFNQEPENRCSALGPDDREAIEAAGKIEEFVLKKIGLSFEY